MKTAPAALAVMAIAAVIAAIVVSLKPLCKARLRRSSNAPISELGPTEPQALSISIDESAGTVTISSYGTATIKGEPNSDSVRFVDDDPAWGELSGKINRFTGAVEFRLVTSIKKEPLTSYSGSCKPARSMF